MTINRFVLKIVLFTVLSAIAFYILHRRSSKTFTSNPDSKYTWPIRTRKTQEGYIELRLDYNLDSLTIAEEFTVADNLVMTEGAQMHQMTFKDIAKLPESQWKEAVPREAYLVYPQPIDLVGTVKHLMEGNPIAVTPIYGRPLRFRHLSSAVCHPLYPESQKYDVVVVVKSAVVHFESRQRFRKNYGRFTNANAGVNVELRVGLVFILGISAHEEENGNHSANAILQETLEYDDLIVGDFKDTYRNLTVKMIHAYQWAATFCRHSRPVFIFMDDDVQFDIEKIVRILNSNSKDHLESQFIGDVQWNASVQRPITSKYPKWELHKDEFPFPKYPTYAKGAATVVGFGTAERLALGMMFTKPLHIEDTFIGLVSAKLEITYIKNCVLVHCKHSKLHTIFSSFI